MKITIKRHGYPEWFWYGLSVHEPQFGFVWFWLGWRFMVRTKEQVRHCDEALVLAPKKYPMKNR